MVIASVPTIYLLNYIEQSSNMESLFAFISMFIVYIGSMMSIYSIDTEIRKEKSLLSYLFDYSLIFFIVTACTAVANYFNLLN